MSTSRRARGSHIEMLAEAMLQRAGLKTVARNFTCRMGEIDLIMEDGNALIFVEVRFRETTAYGDPLETITKNKQLRIVRAANFFLQRNPEYLEHNCRFDAVGATGSPTAPDMRWITNAFSA
jgi:putative endonuclease